MRSAAALKQKQVKKRKGAFQKGAWTQMRMDKFKDAVNKAAAARAMRIAMGVTLLEVAAFYGYNVSAPSYWESGKYFGWTDETLEQHLFNLRRIKSQQGKQS